MASSVPPTHTSPRDQNGSPDGRSEPADLRSIIERMAEGTVIVDLEGLVRFTNQATEQLFGRRRVRSPRRPGDSTVCWRIGMARIAPGLAGRAAPAGSRG